MNKVIIGVLSAVVLTAGTLAYAQTFPTQDMTGSMPQSGSTFGGSVSGYGPTTGYGAATDNGAATDFSGVNNVGASQGDTNAGASPTGVAPYGPSGSTNPSAISPARGVGIVFQVPQTVSAGAHQQALAVIAFDDSQLPDSVAIPVIPVQLVISGGSASDFQNCSLVNVSSLGTPLNTGANALTGLPSEASAITFNLDTPLIIPGGQSVAVALTCDVSSQTPVGTTVTISINAASIPAATSNGGSIVPAADINGSTGQALPTYGTLTIVGASSNASSPSSTRRPPGVPNTGEGGNAAASYLLLALSGFVILLGSLALTTRLAKKEVK